MEFITNYFQENNTQQLLLDWGLNLVIALAMFIIGRWVARAVTKSVRKLLEIRDMDETVVTFLGNMVYGVLITAILIAALDVLGLPIASLVAVLGAAGLAIGLALKDSLSNFAAGIMLVIFRPFTVGDFVEAGGVSGKVEEIRIFETVLITGDNRIVIVPNGQVYSGTITNYTARDTRRIDLTIGVGYDDDLKVVRSVLERICAEHPLVLKDPAPGVALTNLGASSVDFAMRAWAKTGDYSAVRNDLLETAKFELEAAGCNIPYPQTDVHIHQAGA